MKNHSISNGSVSRHATVVVWATLAIFSFLFASSVYADTCEFRTYTGAIYANGMFVTVGGCGGATTSTSVIVTTPDGYSPHTEQYNHDKPGSEILAPVTYAGCKFVAVGSGEVVTPSNGVQGTGQYDITVGPLDIVYANNLFVCSAGGVMLTSPQAAAGTWTARPLGDGGFTEITKGVAYGNNKFVAVGQCYDDAEYLFSATSSDGITWATHHTVIEGKFCSVAFSGSIFVATTSQSWDNNVYTSPDGITWTGHRIGPLSAGFYPKRIRNTWAGLVAVGKGNPGTSAAYVSTDGVNWTAISGAGTSWLFDVAAGPSSLVGVGYMRITPFYESGVTLGAYGVVFDHHAGSGSVEVTAAAAYPYGATSTADWVHVTSGASYLGSATVTFTVDANTGAEDRTGGIIIENRHFQINQSCVSSERSCITPILFPLLLDN